MKAVLFDLDGTLHDRASTLRTWLSGHVTKFGLPAEYAARFVALDDIGYRPKSEVMPRLVEHFGLRHSPEELLADFDTHAYSSPVAMLHAHPVLHALRHHRVRVGVVTNGFSGPQRQTMTGLNLGALVQDLVISEEVGVRKPDPHIYTLALDRLGVDAADAWFVGDSPRNDVWGPQQVGLRAAHLPTGHALNGDLRDVRLRDLRDVLTLP